MGGTDFLGVENVVFSGDRFVESYKLILVISNETFLSLKIYC